MKLIDFVTIVNFFILFPVVIYRTWRFDKIKCNNAMDEIHKYHYCMTTILLSKLTLSTCAIYIILRLMTNYNLLL